MRWTVPIRNIVPISRIESPSRARYQRQSEVPSLNTACALLGLQHEFWQCAQLQVVDRVCTGRFVDDIQTAADNMRLLIIWI